MGKQSLEYPLSTGQHTVSHAALVGARVVGLESWTWTRVGLESGFWQTWTWTWTWTLRAFKQQLFTLK